MPDQRRRTRRRDGPPPRARPVGRRPTVARASDGGRLRRCPAPAGHRRAGSRRPEVCPGEVVALSPARLSDARLKSAAGLIRSFHDATAGTSLAGDQDVVCHVDFGLHNIVFDGEEAVTIIDWDADTGPGPRLADFAHAAWCCADVCEGLLEVIEQARKVRLMCDAYGREDPATRDSMSLSSSVLRGSGLDHATIGQALDAEYERSLSAAGVSRDALVPAGGLRSPDGHGGRRQARLPWPARWTLLERARTAASGRGTSCSACSRPSRKQSRARYVRWCGAGGARRRDGRRDEPLVGLTGRAAARLRASPLRRWSVAPRGREDTLGGCR